MNDDLIQDLKQFIAATVTQSTSDIREDITGIREDITGIHEDITGIRDGIKTLSQRVYTLDEKIDALSEAVADAVDTTNSETQKQLDDHDRRILKLEQRAA